MLKEKATYTRENRDRWLKTIKFTGENLGKIPLEKTEFCLIASGGAMGEAGRVSVYYREDRKLVHYHGSIKSGFKLSRSDFLFFYLGAGNFLYIKPELYETFEKATENMRLSEIYSRLAEIIMHIKKTA